MVEPGGRKLLLKVDHGVIAAAEGDRSLLPPGVREPAGISLLEVVHPVDRERIAGWLGEAPGASPAFRRAAADEPPRWFRLISAVPEVDGRRRLLLEEVTAEVREGDLRRRVMGILARTAGEELLERIPAVAMELVGGCGALLADVHGPLAVVRSTAGETGVPEGAALTVAGSPLEAALEAPGSRVYEDGLGERFPASVLVNASGARSAAVVPVHAPEGKTLAVLTVLGEGPHRFADWERELLEALAVRAGLELSAPREGAKGAPGGRDAAAVATGLASEGAVNAFGNLLAAIGLNCELALSDPELPQSLMPRLERIAASVGRGGRLVRLIGMLSEPGNETVAPVRPAVVLRELADLLPLCAEGLEISVEGPGDETVVWASEGVLYSVVSSLLLAAAAACPAGLHVEAGWGRRAVEASSPAVDVVLDMSPRNGTGLRSSWEPVPAALEAARRTLTGIGGTIDLEVEGDHLRVRIGLMEVRPDETGPHRPVSL